MGGFRPAQGRQVARHTGLPIIKPSFHATRRRAASFHRDDGGQLLILTGVLLVLGFVVLGTAVVQLHGLEDSTARLQRGSLLESVDQLVATFNQTVVKSVDLGDTNLTDFQQRMAFAETRMRETGTRAGLYVSVELRENPDRGIYWRDSRCGAYDRTYVDTGIIIGYDRETKRETITGAVYDIHITDGRQSIDMDYYVKVFDCMVRATPSFVDATNSTTGTVEHVAGSHTQGSGTMWVNETLSGTVQHNDRITVDSTSIRASGWNNADNIVTDGSGHSTHPLPFTDDYLDFRFLPPTGMGANAVTTSYTIAIDALHAPGVTNDDQLRLSAIYDKPGQVETIEYLLSPLKLSETRFTFTVPAGPLGNAHWTHDELENTTWRLEVDNLGAGGDVLRTFHIDYATAEIDWVEPQGYQVESYFQFAQIPKPYDAHAVNLTYTVTPGTSPEEVFYLQVYDTASPNLWTTIKEMRASDGSPHVMTPPIELLDSQENGNAPWFRIVDPGDDDNDPPGDRDTLEVHWFQVMSRVSA